MILQIKRVAALGRVLIDEQSNLEGTGAWSALRVGAIHSTRYTSRCRISAARPCRAKTYVGRRGLAQKRVTQAQRRVLPGAGFARKDSNLVPKQPLGKLRHRHGHGVKGGAQRQCMVARLVCRQRQRASRVVSALARCAYTQATKKEIGDAQRQASLPDGRMRAARRVTFAQ